MQSKILVIDDDRDMCELLHDRLALKGYEVCCREQAEEAIELLQDRDFDVVITDMFLNGASGLDICRRIQENRPNTPVIVITGFGDMSSAIAAIRAGAHDFMSKPIDMSTLELALQRALSQRHLREQIRRLRQAEVPPVETLGSLIGASRAMRTVYDLLRRVSASDTTVLLSGESGTGKELVARALHENSLRCAGEFVAINCAAVPSELLESELFGHVRGAFTDARTERRGLLEQARNGTLLLDEIGELPLDMQPKLLRVLQERQVRPVGGNTTVPMNARIVAATNRDLQGEVEAGRFREDLFYRLNVVQVHIPPLRGRGNDVLLLAEHFVARFARRAGREISIAPEAQRKLLAYDWPGNVRQLENSIERAVALTRGDLIQLDDLPEKVRSFEGWSKAAEDVDLENVLTLDQMERRQIERALRQAHGNKTRAAKALGIDRRTLYRKLDRYEGVPRASMPREPGQAVRP